MLKGLFRALPPKDTYFWFLPSYHIREPERISHLEMQIPSKTTSCVVCLCTSFYYEKKLERCRKYDGAFDADFDMLSAAAAAAS